ncbi:hypothetical protein [Terracidiphilus gabretensis]|uniref:hypothetical protein n=1 Tax=Terracidiphilus gabretensis TaxID=1577687 RepID=UPI0018D22D7E|nr:hypothetical protein [Terracidiphilus gabretensis]
MKRAFWLALTFCATLHPLARPQALPDNPAPAQAHDPMWARVQNLKPGTPIVVSDTYGPPVRCLFAGATEASLDCNPFGNPPNTGFRFNRVDVISVELDRPGQNTLQAKHAPRNYHPGWIASMVVGGTLMGVGFAQQVSAGHAAAGGAISAVIIGGIGAPFAFSSDHNFMPARPQFGIGIPFALHFRQR